MMSSHLTLRLNRRSAFSRDSPSCNRISATLSSSQTRLLRNDFSARLRQIATHTLLAAAMGRGLFGSLRVVRSNVEQRRLRRCMFTQFSHLIDAALRRLLLLSLVSALRLVSLFLLSCVFFLSLCECRSASWHRHPLNLFYSS